MSIIWSDAEISRAKRLRKEGLKYYEIASQMPGRTEKSVRAFLAKIGYGQRGIKLARGGIGSVMSIRRPMDDLIEARDRRANEPRAAGGMQGEPPFSQSPLARPPRGGVSERRESVTVYPLTCLDPASAD